MGRSACSPSQAHHPHTLTPMIIRRLGSDITEPLPFHGSHGTSNSMQSFSRQPQISPQHTNPKVPSEHPRREARVTTLLHCYKQSPKPPHITNPPTSKIQPHYHTNCAHIFTQIRNRRRANSTNNVLNKQLGFFSVHSVAWNLREPTSRRRSERRRSIHNSELFSCSPLFQPFLRRFPSSPNNLKKTRLITSLMTTLPQIGRAHV